MYKLTKENNTVIRISDNATIPLPAHEPEGWNYMDWLAAGGIPEPYVVSFAELQEAKRQEIRASYATMDCDNYTAANLVVWAGGEVSATRLYGAYNLAKETGQTSVVFYDAANLPHTLLLADAIQVVAGVATNSRICFDKKQALMLQIDGATTQAELDLINW